MGDVQQRHDKHAQQQALHQERLDTAGDSENYLRPNRRLARPHSSTFARIHALADSKTDGQEHNQRMQWVHTGKRELSGLFAPPGKIP